MGLYSSAFSRRRSSRSIASRIKLARRRLPTNVSIRRIVSTGNLIVVGFIPSGGRPIPVCLSVTGTMSNVAIVDATVYYVYDIVYGKTMSYMLRQSPLSGNSGEQSTYVTHSATNREAEAQMAETSFNPTRRALLGALSVASVAPWSGLASDTAADRRKRVEVELPLLRRSAERRSLSRFRYQNAESFFVPVEQRFLRCPTTMLYHVGIVLQLGLSSHLLDAGFDDAWCARHIGLHLTKSLSFANATGLNANSSDLERLAAILSPYCKWRDADMRAALPECPFSDDQICGLTRIALDQVRSVTGHSRPRGRGNRQRVVSHG